MSEENKDNEERRPSKMRGVAFPKAKYGAILAAVSYTHLTLPTNREV